MLNPLSGSILTPCGVFLAMILPNTKLSLLQIFDIKLRIYLLYLIFVRLNSNILVSRNLIRIQKEENL